jgi:hypothetical protein
LFGKTTSAMRCSSVAAMVLDQQHGIWSLPLCTLSVHNYFAYWV